MAAAPIAVDTIAQSIQLAVAPVFLLTGIGSLLNVFATRLGRITDRARKLENDITGYTSERRTTAIAELAILDRRMAATHWSIALCSCSALLVCLVVAVLFVSEVATLRGSYLLPAVFIAAMALLIAGLLLFLYEVQIALRSVRVRAALLVDGGE